MAKEFYVTLMESNPEQNPHVLFLRRKSLYLYCMYHLDVLLHFQFSKNDLSLLIYTVEFPLHKLDSTRQMFSNEFCLFLGR